jgi:hypothetical protein
MVPLRLRNNWRPVSGTLGFYALYSYYFRYEKHILVKDWVKLTTE